MLNALRAGRPAGMRSESEPKSENPIDNYKRANRRSLILDLSAGPILIIELLIDDATTCFLSLVALKLRVAAALRA